jgi:3-phenylpropionate/cinnamic acid dioxygenase small subunit
MGLAPVSTDERRAVEEFLYEEARLADSHRYEEWLALWTDDALYWVPAAGGKDTDPERQASYIYDNIVRLRTRLGMLISGEKFSQLPPSQLVRVVSNIVVEGKDDDGDIMANAKFILLESRREMILWGGDNYYKLRPNGETFKLVQKQVVLVNHAEPMRKMSFIL